MKVIFLIALCLIATTQYAQFTFSFGTPGRLFNSDQFTQLYAGTYVSGNNTPIFNDGGAVQPAGCNDWVCKIGIRNLTDSIYEFKYLVRWGSFNGDPCGNPKDVIIQGTVPPHSDKEFQTPEDFWMGVAVIPNDPAVISFIIDRRHL